ncbi:MAG TPA: hypothetical protein VFH26_08435, partial [Gemmatimonadales bacterium]|nr:hypothetical protein [Gemmatimonadales bacterium]
MMRGGVLRSNLHDGVIEGQEDRAADFRGVPTSALALAGSGLLSVAAPTLSSTLTATTLSAAAAPRASTATAATTWVPTTTAAATTTLATTTALAPTSTL